MSSLSCSFCEHANPDDAKFCNACGSPLHLALCQRCEAINDVGAARCHACEAPLHYDSPLSDHVQDPIDPGDSRASSIVRPIEPAERNVAMVDRATTIAAAEALSITVQGGGTHIRTPTVLPVRLLRLALFAVFVVCALAAVLYNKRFPLPRELSDTSLATMSVMPPDQSDLTQRARSSVPSPRLPAKTSARISGGPIEVSVPEGGATSSASPTFGIDESVVRPALPEATPRGAASHDIETLPYPVTREQCTDSVAAMALCTQQGAKDGR